jgi:hypothetical protein
MLKKQAEENWKVKELLQGERTCLSCELGRIRKESRVKREGRENGAKKTAAWRTVWSDPVQDTAVSYWEAICVSTEETETRSCLPIA